MIIQYLDMRREVRIILLNYLYILILLLHYSCYRLSCLMV